LGCISVSDEIDGLRISVLALYMLFKAHSRDAGIPREREIAFNA
jgi:hypothetical protein